MYSIGGIHVCFFGVWVDEIWVILLMFYFIWMTQILWKGLPDCLGLCSEVGESCTAWSMLSLSIYLDIEFSLRWNMCVDVLDLQCSVNSKISNFCNYSLLVCLNKYLKRKIWFLFLFLLDVFGRIRTPFQEPR